MTKDNSPDEVQERQEGLARGKQVAEDAKGAAKAKQGKKQRKSPKHPTDQRAGLVQKPPGE